MDILNKIYNSEYFVIGLFVVIGILAVIFLVLVFSGKKKKKKENVNEIKEDSNKLEENLATIDNTNNLVDSTNNLNVNDDITQPIETLNIDNSINNDASMNNDEIQDLGKMTFEPINDPITEPEVKPIEPVVETPEVIEEQPKEEENLFNTSIFHEMPAELANISIDPIIPNVDEPKAEMAKEENNSASLFEPLPNMDSVEIPKINENNEIRRSEPSFDLPSFEVPTIKEDLPSVKEEPKVDIKPIETHERVPMPNQFSSVYVNKEKPKVEEPKPVINENKVPPYDPTLFERKFEHNFDQPTIPEVKKVEPVVANNMNEVKMPEVNSIPPLEPMNSNVNVQDFELPQINPNNTFDFELPSLAKTKTEEVSNNNNVSNIENNNNSFPNFTSETYDIK